MGAKDNPITKQEKKGVDAGRAGLIMGVSHKVVDKGIYSGREG